MRYIWDTEEQHEVIAAIVQEMVDKSPPEALATSHPRARSGDAPDADELARDLERLSEQLAQADLPASDRAVLLDQLGLLAGRCQWVSDAQQRTFLEQRVDSLFQSGGKS
jgi:MoxR-like ATPase